MSRLSVAFGMLISSLILGSVTAAPMMVVHLPNAPIESEADVAAAVARLADAIAVGAGSDVDVRVFSRWSDAVETVDSSPGDVVMVLTERPYHAQLLDTLRLRTVATFQRDGRLTYRKRLVMRADDDIGGAPGLPALQGKRLALVELAARGGKTLLESLLLADTVMVDEWFAELQTAPRDPLAAANVLFGQSDAAFLSEHNPLLAEQAAGFTIVLDSPEIPLPLLTVNQDALDTDEIERLKTAIESLVEAPGAGELFASMKVDRVVLADTSLAWTPPSRPQAVRMVTGRAAPLSRPASPGDVVLDFSFAVPTERFATPEVSGGPDDAED